MAHTHLALSILPIVYVAVYAEAQRRDEDNKELGSGQLNALVAWCTHAVDCMKALDADEYEAYLRFIINSAQA